MTDRFHYFYDQRWCGQHGIGRFAAELQLKLSGFENVGLSQSPLHPLDPVLLSAWLHRNNASLYVTPGFNAPLVSRARTVLTIHDLIHLHFHSERSTAKFLYYEIVVKRAARAAPVVFTVSESTKSMICEWAKIDPSRVVVVGNGLSSCFNSTGATWQHRRPYFLYVGNHKPHKNVGVLLKAFEKVADQCDLIMSGEPSKAIREMIPHGHVEKALSFTGRVSDETLASYYRGAIATIVPSKYEGFGFPVLEAMGTGCPVISSDTTSLPEVGGDVPFYFNPDSVDELVQQIQRFLAGDVDREKLHQMGIERASVFSWDTVGERVRNALSPLMK